MSDAGRRAAPEAGRGGEHRRRATIAAMGYLAALSIAVLAIVGCVFVFRKRRSGL
jgi:hypothetical protein